MSDDPLTTLAMRERAAGEMDIAAHVMSQYGSYVEQRTYQSAAKQIRALSTTFTDAELLAAAMQFPAVKALVEALSKAEKNLNTISSNSLGLYANSKIAGDLIVRLLPALTPFRKDAS